MTPEKNAQLLKDKIKDVLPPTEALELIQQMTPVIQHVTSTEPWIQSRMIVGAIAATVAGLVGCISLAWSLNTDINAWTTAGTALVGGLTVLHGKFIARKPIGS